MKNQISHLSDFAKNRLKECSMNNLSPELAPIKVFQDYTAEEFHALPAEIKAKHINENMLKPEYLYLNKQPSDLIKFLNACSPYLKYLNLRGFERLTNEEYLAIGKCLQLEFLKIESSVDDKALMALRNLSKLKVLDITNKNENAQGESLTDQGITELANLSSLEELILKNFPASGRGFVNWNSPGIKDVKLSNWPNLSREALKILGRWKSLKSLTLTSEFKDTNFKDLNGLQKLEYLHLGWMISKSMQSIPTELPLKYLSVAGRAVSEKTLKHFSKFSHLISLQLSANRVEGKGLNHLISLPFLERVLLFCDHCNEDVVDEKIKRIICSE